MSLPDPTLVEVFAGEQSELLRRMRALIRTAPSPESDPAVFEGVLRSAHTLKGAARAAGVEATETLTHALEGLFASLRAGDTVWGPEMQSLASRTLDRIEDVLACRLSKRAPPDIGEILKELQRYQIATPRTRPGAPEAAMPAPPGPLMPAESVRLAAGALDDLLHASSELVALAAAGETEGFGLAARAQESYRQWTRMRVEAAAFLKDKEDDLEFAPIRECVQGADRELRELVAEISSESAKRRAWQWDLGRMAERLEDSTLRVRMVEADSIFGSFGPMLRDLAQEYGREIAYRAEGLELPADRVVLQSLKEPVLHLLRNAVSHGIEPESERFAAGKPPAGTIRLQFRSQGERLQVVVEDDGRGLDREALAREGARQGWLQDPSGHSAEELADLIFRPGLSTSATLTKLSGRGMGLAAVRHEVSRLQGEIQVQSVSGKGTVFTISVPLTLSGQQVLLVSEAGHTFGFLSASVKRLLRLDQNAVGMIQGRPSVVVDAAAVPICRLSELLDLAREDSSPGAQMFHVAIVSAGQQMVALIVDELLDVRETVIKPLGLVEGQIPLSAGGVALANGEVAVILNTVDLIDRFRKAARTQALLPVAEEPKPAPAILVVDDSLTTRSLERSVLEAHGYEVLLAVNGKEALDQLRKHAVNLVITDIAMPEMDGFELLERIRADKNLEKLPVIVVSSLESREDRERGLTLGADAYIVKRKFDARELLNTVRQIL